MKSHKKYAFQEADKKGRPEEIQGSHINPAGQPDIENSEKTLKGEGLARPERNGSDERK